MKKLTLYILTNKGSAYEKGNMKKHTKKEPAVAPTTTGQAVHL